MTIGTGKPGLETTLLVDSHVHLHPEHNTAQMFASATQNFEKHDPDSEATRVLMLTQTPRARAEQSELGFEAGCWTTEHLERGLSAVVTNERGQKLILIMGHQIITRERLEVLALCVANPPQDGQPIGVTIESVRTAGGFPVLPWGFGKWLGERGSVIEKILAGAEPGVEGLALGDNAGRPVGFPSPRAFGIAADRRIPVLPGTDPLAIPGHIKRPGSFGFVLYTEFDPHLPAASLMRTLRDLHESPKSFGSRTNPVSFMLDQVSIRIRKALGKGGGA